MKMTLAYGKEGLPLELPDEHNVSVVSAAYRPGVADPVGALREGLRSPVQSRSLREIAASAGKVGIIINDITRATPNALILEALATELDFLADEQVVLFIATGTHRANSNKELEGMIGSEALRRFRIVQNDARAEMDHISVGRARSGNDIRIHRELLTCDVKILTGFIEPHFFAGFSGGGKALMPGMAALSTIVHNHSAANMDHPRSTWGITEGNPVYMEIQEAAAMVEGSFLLNVALNRDKRITAVFAGDVRAAHRLGCDYVRASNMVEVKSAFDIVITSNSGYPLDLNLYQSVKAISAAAGIVKRGGAIIVAAECWDGIPEHGEYGRLLSESENPEALLRRVRRNGFHRQDMWQAQIHAKVVEKAEVYLHTSQLSALQLTGAFVHPCASIEQTVESLVRGRGGSASICVLPEGPVTIPCLS